MSARDDFGSTAGTSSSYKGGAGGLGNGGVGGGMGGGASGGGAGINGGAGSATGLRTNANMTGNTAFGPPGGSALGYAMMDPASMAKMGMGPTYESYSSFTNPDGSAMYPGVGGSFTAPNAQMANNLAAQQYQRQTAQPVSAPPPANIRSAALPIPVRPPAPVPVPTPRPTSYYMAGRVGWPTALQMAIQPTARWTKGTTTGNPFSSYGNPRLGTPGYGNIGSSYGSYTPTGHLGATTEAPYGGGSSSGSAPQSDGWGASGSRSGGYGANGASFGY